MPTFYSLDYSRATFQEFWWGSKNPIIILIAAIVKLLRVQIPGSSDDANVDSTQSFVVDALPTEMEQKFAPLSAQIQSLGFCDPVFHWIEDHNTKTRIVWATFRHASGQHCARIHYRHWDKAKKKERGLFPMFITAFPNGTFLVSSSGKPDIAAPPRVHMNRMPGAPIDTLWAQHKQLTVGMSSGEGPILVTQREQIIEVTERLHEAQRDFHLKRGMFRVQTKKEAAEAAELAVRVEQARASGQQYPEIMAELSKLQDAKASWTSAIWLFVISMGAFIAAGGKQWNLKVTLMLVPILFFHEVGHWLAMRLFGYRNMRMFFIPFFGAAVTGRHWNVAGWKKALVSLAGPLPGIMVGVGLAAVAAITGNDNIRMVAMMLVVLNVINLAPILPLDGGHFLHATLFCRNRWLDLIFKIIAVAGLIVASATGFAPYMLYLGIFLAISLPLSFKMAQVTDKFRAIPTPPMLPGEDKISPNTAAPLIEAVKDALPPSSNNKTIAQYVLQVYETLNARPPSVAATVGLLAAYGGTIIVAGATFLLLAVAQNGSFRDFVARAVAQPTHAVSCDNYQVTRGTDVPAHLSTPRDLIVANCKKNAQATKLYADAKADLPADAALLQFGDSVLLSLPIRDITRSKWFDRFQATTTNTTTVVSNNTIWMSLMFIAPNKTASSNLETELNDYFNSGVSAQISPPWDDTVSASERAKLKAVRRAWGDINEQANKVWADPSLKPFAQQILTASRRGDTDKVAELEKAEKDQVDKLKAKLRETISAKYSKTAFADLPALKIELENTPYTNQLAFKAVHTKIAARLGPSSPTSAPGVSAYVQRTGLLLQIPYANIRDPQYSLPAILHWLCSKECIGFKYDLRRVTYDPDEMD